MKYKVKLTKKAKSYLDKASRKVKERIDAALKNLLAFYNNKSKQVPDVKILKGKYEGLLRLRVGKLRVIFKIEKRKLVILIIEIVPRGKAYR